MNTRRLTSLLLGGLASFSFAEVIWEENFDAVEPNTYGTNTNVGNIQFSNSLTGEVTSVIPAGFTSATGNVAFLSTGASRFAALRPASNPILLPAIGAGGTWTLSFDLFIPTDLIEEVGGMANFRWKDGGANNTNGPADLTFQTLTAGEHHIVYTGTFPIDNGLGPFLPINVRPFINFDQAETAVTEFVYVDNIHFEVDLSEDDPNLISAPSNFGTVVQSEGSYARPLTVENSGAGNVLTITAATISGTNAAQFSVTNTTFPININPGESAIIEVTFDPADDIGSFQASLDIASNDQSDSTLSYDLSGNVEVPFEGRELMVNGDFETGDISGWRDDARITHTTTTVHRGTGAAIYTTDGVEYGSARLATTPPHGVDGLPELIAITPEMIGQPFSYSAWYYRPSTDGMSDEDEIGLPLRWNGVSAGATVIGKTTVGEIPYDTWVRISGTGTIPEFDNDGVATTSVQPTWSFRDVNSDNPTRRMIIDDISLKVDAPVPVIEVPAVITNITVDLSLDLIEITWTSNIGATYAVERSSQLAPDTWVELDDSVIPTENTHTYSDPFVSSLEGNKYFYRVTQIESAP